MMRVWVGTSHGVDVQVRGKPLSVNSLVEAGVFRLDRWPLNFRAGSPVTSFGRHAGIVRFALSHPDHLCIFQGWNSGIFGIFCFV